MSATALKTEAPALTAKPPRAAIKSRSWRTLGLVIALAALALVAVLSISVGARPIPFNEVLSGLFNPSGTEADIIIGESRLPRTVVGLIVGAALGVAGALIQSLTRNPLADPGILGVNAGAAFAVVLGVALFGVTSIMGYIWFAFAGAIIATFAVYLIGAGGRGPINPVRLTLAGVALGAVLQGVSTGISLLNPEAFNRMRFWGAGSLANRDLEMAWVILPFIAVGIVIAFAVSGSLNTIALGDDTATSLGTNVNRTRLFTVIAVTLLCGAATAAAGPIGFVGLMIPHVARWIVGPDQRWIFAYSIVLAPALLLLSDVIGRVITPGELQVGIVTAFVGAPVLIALVRRKKVSGL
ncbi:Fe(3+)-siderophore ABC transporter permease [Haematomicrobium sanguinis]|uniref:Fe(3+)-siderophore ABC transporter permease n=1 Tax=Haematomicrobium sanguinis TaxID=479106 RepID=UPI00047B0702|nr:Fe(3+)-siderophore ABC transporter permease [Haematomicrobium sanguinis]